MKYPTVIVNGVSVRVDEDGRYNLNDLHAQQLQMERLQSNSAWVKAV
ncbi:hypothetical protein N5V55_16860 [Escherichia coli]|nr:hypothetical protein [Escherichia coli]